MSTADPLGIAGQTGNTNASGAPDAAWLQSLANELFRTLPGQSLPSVSAVPSVPSVPAVSAVPAVPVAESVSGAHGASSTALPREAGHLPPQAGNPALVPAGASATLPAVTVPAQHSLGVDLGSRVQTGGSANSLGTDFQQDLHRQLDPQAHPRAQAVAAQLGSGALPSLSFIEVPQSDELSALLAGLDTLGGSPGSGAHPPSASPALPAVGSAAPSFYFLQPAAASNATAATSGIAVPSRSEAVQHVPASAHPPFDVNAVRRDFPILKERVNGRPLIWLDNAATTQKPQSVIDRVSYFYEHENSNIHRAAHELAARATDAYEAAREKVRGFLNASSTNEIVFVRGTTEGINLVAQSWGRQHLKAGDEIIVTHLEHHANIVPWQQLCQQTGAVLNVVPVDDDGQVILTEYERLFTPRTKIVSFTHVSNALGTVTPAKAMIDIAHAHGAKVLLDGAQSVSHLRIDVSALGCDWFVFSGHKVFGPTGIGVVYGREALLNATEPWQGGGNMIADVTFEKTVYQPAPSRFEAGTGNIADAVGLGAAIDYVTRLGMDNIAAYEHGLLEYATHHMKQIPGLRLIGTAADKASVLSFVLEGHQSEDVGAELNREGIAVRSGHHCAQPILRRFGVETTVRPSLAFYNTCAEIDVLVGVLRRLARK